MEASKVFTFALIVVVTFLFANILMFSPSKKLSFYPRIPDVSLDNPVKSENKEQNEEDKKEDTFWSKAEIIPKQKSNKKYKIAVLPAEGVKVSTVPRHENIQFFISNNSAQNLKKIWPRMGFYHGIFDVDYRLETKEQYPFDLYKEDVAISEIYHDTGLKLGDVNNVDLIFIPPIGVTLNDAFADNLYDFLVSSDEKFPSACAYQVYMSKKEREQNGVFVKHEGFVPDYPKLSFRTFGGLLVKKKDLNAISVWTSELWFRNRYDSIVQHYCEVLGNKIIVSPTNLYTPVIDF